MHRDTKIQPAECLVDQQSGARSALPPRAARHYGRGSALNPTSQERRREMNRLGANPSRRLTLRQSGGAGTVGPPKEGQERLPHACPGSEGE